MTDKEKILEILDERFTAFYDNGNKIEVIKPNVISKSESLAEIRIVFDAAGRFTNFELE